MEKEMFLLHLKKFQFEAKLTSGNHYAAANDPSNHWGVRRQVASRLVKGINRRAVIAVETRSLIKTVTVPEQDLQR